MRSLNPTSIIIPSITVALIVSSILISQNPKLALNEIFCGLSCLTGNLAILSKEIALLISISGAAFLVYSQGRTRVLKNRKRLTKFLAFAAILVLVLYTTCSQFEFQLTSIVEEDDCCVFNSRFFVEAQNSVDDSGKEVTVSDECIDCHARAQILEAISLDWENSKHAEVGTTCIDCHQADPSEPDSYPHNGFDISHVVSPQDCAKCHNSQAEEFKQSLHSLGAVYYEYLFSAEKLPYIESQMEGGFIVSEGQETYHAATLRGCQACHGTNMTGKSIEDFTVWPNNGIGRINPDGSRGSCSSCHSRHTFSIREARHPETCGQCHVGPDHPQLEIFTESKHGNIYASEHDKWGWDVKDWQAGIDYRTPTCAGCHMSSASMVPSTHDVSSRLSWELETPISRRTDNTANSLGVSFSDGTTWEVKLSRMKKVCTQCHSKIWVDNYYEQADIVVELYNDRYKSAKSILDELYEEDLLTKTSFDEPIEFKIYEMWHHEGRRARMGAFMMGPDYVQWHGFYELLKNRIEIEHMANELRTTGENTIANGTDDFYQILPLSTGVLAIILVAVLGWIFIQRRKPK
jgi:nitrate/TMAO reductase-like tetraheme cytochrome c subunit